MKTLRKSFNGNSNKDSIRSQISTPVPLPSVSKPPSAILPPQKVIRALSTYRPQAPQELPFQKGDFFYVLKDVDNQGAWYEAHNPVSGARGLVPRSMFEEFSKGAIPNRTSHIGLNSPVSPRTNVPPPPKTHVFYAIVLHDFVAERADELDAKSGDAITVVAQSNREWFVAKPIGRLGRPGLIPVSFVEIHDPATGEPIPDVNALMDRGDLPRVEDWKRAMFNYKQNSITLGVIDPPNRDSMPKAPSTSQTLQTPQPDPSMNSHFNQPRYSTNGPAVIETPESLPEGILLSANVVSFHYEMEEYWFRIDSIFQPYSPPGQTQLPHGKQLVLFRVYNDFYDFQVSLLETFPREAGRQPPHVRILPYMPGPAQDVDDNLTATRRAELDEYLHSLCNLNKSGAKYILEHQVVREFLALKPGDVETEIEPRAQEINVLFSQGKYGDEYGGEARDGLGRLRIQDDFEKSEGSEYEDEGYAPSPQRRANDRDRQSHSRSSDRRPSYDSGLRLHAHSQNHQRTGSTTSIHRAPSPLSSTSRSESPHLERNSSPHPLRNSGDYNYNNTNGSTLSMSSARSSQPTSSRSRSHSTAAASNVNTPPISAANPQTAFVKIKIFDRLADDLIAIRVHPRVSHAELMEKVQARLGSEVSNLKYRDSGTNVFVEVDSDEDLRIWIDNTDKHVLFAD